MGKLVESTLFTTPLHAIDDLLGDHHGSVVDVAKQVHSDYSKFSKEWQAATLAGAPKGTNWHSLNIGDHYPELRVVYDSLQPHVDNYAIALTGRSDLVAEPLASWLSFFDENSFNFKHNHPYCMHEGKLAILSINAVVYLQVQEGDFLEIYWPNESIQTSQGRMDFQHKEAVIPLRNNTALLLPAWTLHGNPPRKRDGVKVKPKISMTVNYQYRNIAYGDYPIVNSKPL